MNSARCVPRFSYCLETELVSCNRPRTPSVNGSVPVIFPAVDLLVDGVQRLHKEVGLTPLAERVAGQSRGQ